MKGPNTEGPKICCLLSSSASGGSSWSWLLITGFFHRFVLKSKFWFWRGFPPYLSPSSWSAFSVINLTLSWCCLLWPHLSSWVERRSMIRTRSCLVVFRLCAEWLPFHNRRTTKLLTRFGCLAWFPGKWWTSWCTQACSGGCWLLGKGVPGCFSTCRWQSFLKFFQVLWRVDSVLKPLGTRPYYGFSGTGGPSSI